MMRRLVIILSLCIGGLMTAGAQTFTQKLQKSTAGEGRITVTQDKAIDDLVNGTKAAPAKPVTPKQTENTNKKTTATNQEKKEKTLDELIAEHTATPVATDTIDRKVAKGVKVNGYRVQVFAGGNTRNDRLKAERTRDEIKALFPGEPLYVHFYSPRWICRMGNYRTYEEAHEVLTRVQSLGYSSAIIVKGKITVAY